MDYPLETNGYLFFKAVYERDLVEAFNRELNEYITRNQIFVYLNKPMDMNEEEFYVNNTYSQMDNFDKMLYYMKPVIENRGNKNRVNDIGFYDFYQANRIFPNLLEIFQVKTLEAILNKTTTSRWKFHRANIHISNNVQRPIGFHSDGVRDEVRVLIYLSDILEEKQGTPSFIRYSHTAIGKAEGIKRENVRNFIGEKGDILISYENGLHRKLPQEIPSINGFIAIHFVKN